MRIYYIFSIFILSLFGVLGQNAACKALPAFVDSVKAVNSEEKALLVVDRANQYLKQKNCADSLHWQLLNSLCDIYFNLGNFPAVIELTDSLNEEAFAAADRKYLLELYSIRANALSNQMRPTQAIKTTDKALALSLVLDSLSYYKLLINKGVMLSSAGRFSQALEVYSESLKHFKKTKQDVPAAIAYNNIAEIYRERFSDFNRALKIYKNAARINQINDNSFHLAKNYTNMGICFQELGQPDSALYYFTLSIKTNERINNSMGVVKAQYNLGSYYLDLKQPEKALYYFNKNLAICKETGFLPGTFFNYLGLASLQVGKKNYTKALEYLEMANMLPIDNKAMEMQESYTQVKIESLKGLGRYEEALNMFEAFNIEQDSVNSFKNEQTTLMLRAEYEAEIDNIEKQRLVEAHNSTKQVLEKEKNRNTQYLFFGTLVIVLLVISIVFYFQKQKAYNKQKKLVSTINQQNEALAKAQAQVSAQLEMKNKILSVLGHDLRAPFASISGLLSAMNNDSLTLQEAKPLTKQLSLEVEQTLTTLSNILAWSRLQLNESGIYKEDFVLCDLMQAAISYVQPAADAKGVLITGECDKSIKISADPNQIRSILNNLLNNAIKFSENKGLVKIEYTHAKDMHIITVADTGVGLNQKAHESLNTHQNYTSQGTAGEKGTGIGLSLVRDFVALHKGELLYYNNKPKGTIVEIRLPV